MGRPLNDRFFGNPTSPGFQLQCVAWFTGEGGTEAGYIVRQRSNLQYEVESVAGPGTRREVLQMVQGAPAAEGEMQIVVSPEAGAAAAEAQLTIDTNSSGEVSAATLVDGGFGYYSNGTITITDATLTGNDDAVVSYTVANGSINSVGVQTPGTGYTADQTGVAVNTADIPDPASSPPTQSARIINANQVKTFEGNRYVWPASGGAGSGGRAGILEADLGGS